MRTAGKLLPPLVNPDAVRVDRPARKLIRASNAM